MSEELNFESIIVHDADGDEVNSIVVEEVAGVIVNDAGGEPEPA